MAKGDGEARGISRRTLLIGGGVGIGLAVAWTLWPRRYRPNLVAGPDETILDAFLKIGKDGRVIVIVPQTELGQGVATALPQILADELGADWRSVGVEPAPLNPLYANQLLAEELSQGSLPEAIGPVRRWTAQEVATRDGLILTGGSTSVRAFETRLREAGAAARALLTAVAARRWGVEPDELVAHTGFVWRGEEAIAFADLAEAAAAETLPSGGLPMRSGTDNRLIGQPLPRLDAPGKVDGSALFAADVRLPDMVFASVLAAPAGGRLLMADAEAANAIPEALATFQRPGWIGAVATNSWAAERAVGAMAPRWEVPELRPSTRSIDAALGAALDGDEVDWIHSLGDAEAALAGSVPAATYAVGLAPGAPPETLSATARLSAGRLEVWAPTQAPGLARDAAAAEAGLAASDVTFYPMLAVGGGYGRKLEMDAIRQAVSMAVQLGRPVQLAWSRLEDIRHDRFRPAAMARLEGHLTGASLTAWRARIAAPATAYEVAERTGLGQRLFGGGRASAAGAIPPYAISNMAIGHVPAEIGIPTGLWRSNALSYTTFFTESFVDELARQVGVEPFSFRISLLGRNPRLANVLTMATALGGWDGGPSGSGMGLAVLAAYGSCIATLVEVEVAADQRVRVLRAVCAVDCGRVVNPELVRQQIEGGLIHGISAALGPELVIEGGLPLARNLGELGLPTMADAPTITVELVTSDADPGGITELAVPTAAPAIANALHALTGERVRRLPLRIGSGR